MGFTSKIERITLAAAVAAGIMLYAADSEADDGELSTETLVESDMSSDTRVEYKGNGLETAVEQFTDGDYDDHTTLFGFRTPQIDGAQLRLTGRVDYGEETDTNGGFAGNLVYDLPDERFRIGAGGGAATSDDWTGHASFRYIGDLLHANWNVLHHEEEEWPVDARGYASVLLPSGPYASLAKCEGPNMFGMLGHIGGKGKFNARSRNWVDFDDGSSKHDVMLTWNSTKDRGSYEFQNRFWTNVEAEWDHLDGHYDPTIGFPPMLGMYGEHDLEVRFSQDASGMGGGASFAWDPDNRKNMAQIGIDYRHNFHDEDVLSAEFITGANLDGYLLFAGVKTDTLNKELEGTIYVGKWFDM
jgi:hypothetical protein